MVLWSSPWDKSRKVRTVRDLTLHEVSTVSGWPAYAATSASVRAAGPSQADPLTPELQAALVALLDGSITADQRRLLDYVYSVTREAA